VVGSAAEKHVSISDLWRRRLSRQSGALSHPHASTGPPAISHHASQTAYSASAKLDSFSMLFLLNV
jgi:hypothetical protein